jgi:hypothetical protein
MNNKLRKKNKKKAAKRVEKISWDKVSISQTAYFCGVSEQSIYNWCKEGLPRNSDKTFDLQAVHLWIVDLHKNSEASLKAKKTQEEIEKLKMFNARESGQMVNRQEMEDVLVSRATTLRNFIERSLALNRPARAMKNIEELASIEYELCKSMMEAYTGQYKK